VAAGLKLGRTVDSSAVRSVGRDVVGMNDAAGWSEQPRGWRTRGYIQLTVDWRRSTPLLSLRLPPFSPSCLLPSRRVTPRARSKKDPEKVQSSPG
jgi:hypothetical protein